MKTTYDKVADATYIYFNDGKIVETKPISQTIYIDYDKDQKIVGIEILEFSSTISEKDLIKLKKKELEIPFTVIDKVHKF